MNKKYVCPICGYDGLDEPAYGKHNEPSYNICPCCCFEFGVDDSSDYQSLEKDFNDYREKWIKEGCEWFETDQKPRDWSPLKQLQNLDLSQQQIESYFSEKRKFENRVIKFFTDKIPEIQDFMSLTTLSHSYFDEAGMYIVIADINRYFENCVKNGRFDKVKTFLEVYWDFYKEFEAEYHKLERSDTMKNLTRVELFETIDTFDEKVKEKVVGLLLEELKKDYLLIS